MFPCFGVYDNTSYSELTYHLMMQDGKTLFTPAQEGYKEALRYLNRLYSEGLLDQEIFTTTPDVVTAKLMDTNDIVGTFCAWTISNGVGYDRMDDFTQLLPLEGPNGGQRLDRHQRHRNWPQYVRHHLFQSLSRSHHALD